METFLRKIDQTLERALNQVSDNSLYSNFLVFGFLLKHPSVHLQKIELRNKLTKHRFSRSENYSQFTLWYFFSEDFLLIHIIFDIIT